MLYREPQPDHTSRGVTVTCTVMASDGDDDGGLLSDDAFRRSPLPLAARIAAHTGDVIASAAAADGAAVSRSQPVRRKGKGKGKGSNSMALPRTLRLDEGRSRSQPNPAPASAARSASTDADSATDAGAVAEAAAADDAIPTRALFYGCCTFPPHHQFPPHHHLQPSRCDFPL